MNDWQALRDSLSRHVFVERYLHPFLWVGADPDVTVEEFATLVGQESGSHAHAGDHVNIVPLIKSGVNPYAGRVMVGRARNCDIVIRQGSVSKLHADFEVKGPDSALLTDRRSRNGTKVNGEALEPGGSVAVSSGDRISFGNFSTVFFGPGDVYDRL